VVFLGSGGKTMSAGEVGSARERWGPSAAASEKGIRFIASIYRMRCWRNATRGVLLQKGSLAGKHHQTTTHPRDPSEAKLTLQAKKEAPLDGPALRRLILAGMAKATAPAKPIIEHGESLLTCRIHSHLSLSFASASEPASATAPSAGTNAQPPSRSPPTHSTRSSRRTRRSCRPCSPLCASRRSAILVRVRVRGAQSGTSGRGCSEGGEG
jgi:hypothetical protein